MQSGQGGIRYNDSTKTIQLMDVNKNWVDWQFFDATSPFKFCAVNYTGTFNYTFTNNGLYLFGHTGHQSTISTYQTNATRKDLYYNYGFGYQSNSKCTCSLISAHANDTLKVVYSTPTPAYNPMCALFYLGSSVTTGVEVAGIHDSNVYDTSRSYSVNNVTNRVILGLACGSSSRQVQITTNVNQKATDGLTYGCVSTINETGNVSMTVGGMTGNAPVIFDIQVS